MTMMHVAFGAVVGLVFGYLVAGLVKKYASAIMTLIRDFLTYCEWRLWYCYSERRRTRALIPAAQEFLATASPLINAAADPDAYDAAYTARQRLVECLDALLVKEPAFADLRPGNPVDDDIAAFNAGLRDDSPRERSQPA